jgi:hypothetical protein
LIAESTGKHGKGLVPAPGEPSEGPDRQRADVRLDDPQDIGAEFFRWEFAGRGRGSILQINPFDQPNVQAAKDKTKKCSTRARTLSCRKRARSMSCSQEPSRRTTSRSRRSSTRSASASWSRSSRARVKQGAW